MEGDWQKAMDRASKAAGMRGFVSWGARPQCLACGRESLVSVSCSPSERRRLRQLLKRRKQVLALTEVRELQSLSRKIGFPASSARERAMMKKLRAVGERLARDGGLELLSSVILALPSGPGHERLWRDFVSASWAGIRDASGDEWQH